MSSEDIDFDEFQGYDNNTQNLQNDQDMHTIIKQGVNEVHGNNQNYNNLNLENKRKNDFSNDSSNNIFNQNTSKTNNQIIKPNIDDANKNNHHNIITYDKNDKNNDIWSNFNQNVIITQNKINENDNNDLFFEEDEENETNLNNKEYEKKDEHIQSINQKDKQFDINYRQQNQAEIVSHDQVEIRDYSKKEGDAINANNLKVQFQFTTRDNRQDDDLFFDEFDNEEPASNQDQITLANNQFGPIQQNDNIPKLISSTGEEIDTTKKSSQKNETLRKKDDDLFFDEFDNEEPASNQDQITITNNQFGPIQQNDNIPKLISSTGEEIDTIKKSSQKNETLREKSENGNKIEDFFLHSNEGFYLPQTNAKNEIEKPSIHNHDEIDNDFFFSKPIQTDPSNKKQKTHMDQVINDLPLKNVNQLFIKPENINNNEFFFESQKILSNDNNNKQDSLIHDARIEEAKGLYKMDLQLKPPDRDEDGDPFFDDDNNESQKIEINKIQEISREFETNKNIQIKNQEVEKDSILNVNTDSKPNKILDDYENNGITQGHRDFDFDSKKLERTLEFKQKEVTENTEIKHETTNIEPPSNSYIWGQTQLRIETPQRNDADEFFFDDDNDDGKIELFDENTLKEKQEINLETAENNNHEKDSAPPKNLLFESSSPNNNVDINYEKKKVDVWNTMAQNLENYAKREDRHDEEFFFDDEDTNSIDQNYQNKSKSIIEEVKGRPVDKSFGHENKNKLESKANDDFGDFFESLESKANNDARNINSEIFEKTMKPEVQPEKADQNIENTEKLFNQNRKLDFLNDKNKSISDEDNNEFVFEKTSAKMQNLENKSSRIDLDNDENNNDGFDDFLDSKQNDNFEKQDEQKVEKNQITRGINKNADEEGFDDFVESSEPYSEKKVIGNQKALNEAEKEDEFEEFVGPENEAKLSKIEPQIQKQEPVKSDEELKAETEMQTLNNLHKEMMFCLGIPNQFENLFVNTKNNSIAIDYYSKQKDDFRKQALIGQQQILSYRELNDLKPKFKALPIVSKTINDVLECEKNKRNDKNQLTQEVKTNIVEFFKELNTYWDKSQSRIKLYEILNVKSTDEDKSELDIIQPKKRNDLKVNIKKEANQIDSQTSSPSERTPELKTSVSANKITESPRLHTPNTPNNKKDSKKITESDDIHFTEENKGNENFHKNIEEMNTATTNIMSRNNISISSTDNNTKNLLKVPIQHTIFQLDPSNILHTTNKNETLIITDYNRITSHFSKKETDADKIKIEEYLSKIPNLDFLLSQTFNLYNQNQINLNLQNPQRVVSRLKVQLITLFGNHFVNQSSYVGNLIIEKLFAQGEHFKISHQKSTYIRIITNAQQRRIEGQVGHQSIQTPNQHRIYT